MPRGNWSESWTNFVNKRLKESGGLVGKVFEAYKALVIAQGLCIGTADKNPDYNTQYANAAQKLRDMHVERHIRNANKKAATLYKDWLAQWNKEQLSQQTGIGSYIGGADALADTESEPRKSTGRRR